MRVEPGLRGADTEVGASSRERDEAAIFGGSFANAAELFERACPALARFRIRRFLGNELVEQRECRFVAPHREKCRRLPKQGGESMFIARNSVEDVERLLVLTVECKEAGKDELCFWVGRVARMTQSH